MSKEEKKLKKPKPPKVRVFTGFGNVILVDREELDREEAAELAKKS